MLADSDRPTANFVSHTTPLTVTAELGVVGLVLYLWLLVGGVRLIVRVWRSRHGARAGARRVAPGAVRARALLQRLPRGPAHLAGAGRGGRAGSCGPVPAEAGARAERAPGARRGGVSGAMSDGERLGRLEALGLLAVLLALVTVTLPELGSDPWRFRPGAVDPSGPLAPLVRAAGRGVGRGHRAGRGLRSPRCSAAPPR